MNNELAMRTLAYLITHYKEHDETIINSEEIQAIEFLQQKNQELKNQIETLEKVNKQLICKLDRYDAIVDERDELKKQLKEYKRLGFKHLNDKCNKLENQQKEFIEFLEDKIKFSTKPTTCILLKSILQNYKKIIGDDK